MGTATRRLVDSKGGERSGLCSSVSVCVAVVTGMKRTVGWVSFLAAPQLGFSFSVCERNALLSFSPSSQEVPPDSCSG